MSRGKQRFRQRELARALRGAERSGVPIERVVIDQQGRIIIILDKPAAVDGLDREPVEFEARHEAW
jgi:hypothetical protein